MSKLRSGLSYANVMATLALFIALGGGAYAAINLPKNSVGSKHLKANAVNSSKIKNRSIIGADVNKSRLGLVPSAASAISAVAAQSAQHAATADNASDASSLQGKQIAPLAAAVPTGTTDQVAGSAGPLTVLVSCGSGGTNQAITVTLASTVGGSVRHARFHILPDGISSGSASLSAGGRTDLLIDSFNLDTMGFVFTGGGRSIAGHLLADYSHTGGGCFVSGTLAG